MCPVLMSYGMPLHDYWYGDPWDAVYYLQAHREKLKEQNFYLWLGGLYTHNAVSACIANAFGNKAKYAEQPYDLLPKTKEEKEAEAEKERAKITAQFRAMIAAQKHGKGE